MLSVQCNSPEEVILQLTATHKYGCGNTFGLVRLFVCLALTFVSLDLETLFLVCGYAFARLHCEPKKTPKCFCHIVYKTRPILIKFDACIWLNL